MPTLSTQSIIEVCNIGVFITFIVFVVSRKKIFNQNMQMLNSIIPCPPGITKNLTTFVRIFESIISRAPEFNIFKS